MTGASRSARVAFACAVALSLVAFFAPGSDVPGGPAYSDKLVHAGLFALVALTGLRAGFPLVPLACALVAYSAVSEVMQATLPIGRDGDVWDFVADSVGTGLGLTLGRLLPGRRT